MKELYTQIREVCWATPVAWAGVCLRKTSPCRIQASSVRLFASFASSRIEGLKRQVPNREGDW